MNQKSVPSTPQKGGNKKTSCKKITITKEGEEDKNTLNIPNQNQDDPTAKSPRKIAVNQSQFVQKTTNFHETYKRYRSQDLIGEGTYGKIYKVTKKDTNEVRAIKVIRKDLIPQAELEELVNEINILKDLDSPNILKIFEFYDDYKNYYIITEYINGKDLLSDVNDRPQITEEYISYIFRQIIQGLNYAHSHNLVHRDIKPENIMLECPEQKKEKKKPKKKENSEEEEGEQEDEDFSNITCKIIDWGTGVKYQDGKFLSKKCGTIDYASPEVFKGKYNQKCDIWSCGVILYILLSGEHPFGQVTESTLSMGNKIKTSKFTFENEVWEQISDEAKDLIQKMLHKNPEKRISAQDILVHPWITQNVLEEQPNTQQQKTLKRTLSRLKSFKAETTLQEAVVSYFASHLTTGQEKFNLQQQFQKLDKDGNGTLSKQEMIEGYSEIMGREEAEIEVDRIFEQIDIDGDGSISYNEFIACSIDYKQNFTDKRLQDAFKLFDKDGDGQIDSNEIKEVLGGSLEDNEISNGIWQSVVQEVDTDGDGQISFEEFKILMKKMIREKESLSQDL